jgi:hypothetical protein
VNRFKEISLKSDKATSLLTAADIKFIALADTSTDAFTGIRFRALREMEETSAEIKTANEVQ